jgi:hypothetical protein
LAGLSTLAVIAPAVSGAAQESEIPAAASPEMKLEDVPAGPKTKLTIEPPAKALEAGIQIANKVAACAPLGIKNNTDICASSNRSGEEEALSKLDAQFGALSTRGTF